MYKYYDIMQMVKLPTLNEKFWVRYNETHSQFKTSKSYQADSISIFAVVSGNIL